MLQHSASLWSPCCAISPSTGLGDAWGQRTPPRTPMEKELGSHLLQVGG